MRQGSGSHLCQARQPVSRRLPCQDRPRADLLLRHFFLRIKKERQAVLEELKNRDEDSDPLMKRRTALCGRWKSCWGRWETGEQRSAGELTKKHETVFLTSLSQAAAHYRVGGAPGRVRDVNRGAEPPGDDGRKAEQLAGYPAEGLHHRRL